MIHSPKIRLASLLLLVGLLLRADTWPDPERRVFTSRHGAHRVVVLPASRTRQAAWWSGRTDGSGDPAKAILQARRWWGYRKVLEFDLANPIAPVNALVSEDGTRIVTFDDWHMMGYGPNVVVIYGESGQLIRRLALTDLLSPGDIATLSKSSSSIHWRGTPEFNGRQLILRVFPSTHSSTLQPDSVPCPLILPIDLTTGTPVEPVRDRLSPGELAAVSVSATSPEEDQLPTNPQGHNASDSAADLQSTLIPRLPSDLALRDGSPFDPIPYPAVARMALVHGRVVLDLLVDGKGKVLRAVVVSGPPLLRKAASQWAESWRFQGAFLGSEGHRTRLAVTFGYRPYRTPSPEAPHDTPPISP